MDMNRRQFFKVAAVGLGGSSLAALGVAPPDAFADQVRHFKLARTVETRNTCPYCSVGCGILMYSQGDAAKNVAQNINSNGIMKLNAGGNASFDADGTLYLQSNGRDIRIGNGGNIQLNGTVTVNGNPL